MDFALRTKNVEIFTEIYLNLMIIKASLQHYTQWDQAFSRAVRLRQKILASSTPELQPPL